MMGNRKIFSLFFGLYFFNLSFLFAEDSIAEMKSRLSRSLNLDGSELILLDEWDPSKIIASGIDDSVFVEISAKADHQALDRLMPAKLDEFYFAQVGRKFWLVSVEGISAEFLAGFLNFLKENSASISESYPTIEIDRHMQPNLLRGSQGAAGSGGTTTPNDPQFWPGLNQAGFTAAFRNLSINFSAPCTETVALIDSGVNPNHPDLVGNILPLQYNAIPTTVVSESFQDYDGHGTQMAGLIAAETNNSLGISGATGGRICLQSYRVVDQNGSSTSRIARATRHSISQGIRLASASLPFIQGTVMDLLQTDLNAANALLVMGSGNSGGIQNLNNLPNIVVAGSVDPSGSISNFSVTGTHLDIFAPGVDAFTTLSDESYSVASGTSISTAISAAGLALYHSAHSTMSYPNVLSQMLLRARVITGTPYKALNMAALTQPTAVVIQISSEAVAMEISEMGINSVRNMNQGVFGSGSSFVQEAP